jgi:hypothetical protein
MASDIRIRMNGREQSFRAGSEVRMGRDPARSDLLSDNPLVSRYHARLHPTAAGWAVEDMGSRHGTFAGDRRIKDMPVEGAVTLWLGPPGRGELVELQAGPNRPDKWAVFISYRRSDCAGYATLLHTELQKHFGPEYVFRDIDTLMPGTNYVTRIRSAIGNCAVVIAMIGREWTGRLPNGGRRIDDPTDLLREEIVAALQLGVRTIPVLVQDGRLPPAEELPEPLRPLAQRHALRIDDNGVTYQIAELIRAIEQTVKRQPPASDTDPLTPPDLPAHVPPPPLAAPPVAAPPATVSGAWWLLPVIFGLIGGLIAFAVVRPRNRGWAGWMLITGIIQSIIVGVALAASTG